MHELRELDQKRREFKGFYIERGRTEEAKARGKVRKNIESSIFFRLKSLVPPASGKCKQFLRDYEFVKVRLPNLVKDAEGI